MHSTRQAPRVRKARQPAGNSSTRRDKQRQSSIIQDPNQFSGIPDIGVPELIRFLQTVGIAAIEEDVLEPTSRRTREMCELLLQYFVPHRTKFLQIQKEKAATEFKESLASIMDINCLCEFSIEHAEAMPVFHELQLFLQKIGFIDFTIVDILSPRSHRLQKMLSAIYNYKLFRESAFKQFELLSKNAVDLTATYEACAAEKEALQAKVQQLKAKKEADSQEAQEWDMKNQEAEQIVRQLRKDGDAILKDIDAYKSERHQLKDTLQELQYTMINVIEYVRQLKQYESLDVEALNKDKADLATVSKKNREEIETLELQYPKLEEMAKEMKLFSNNLGKGIQKMESLSKLKADANRQKKTNEAVKQNLLNLAAKQREMNGKLQASSKNLSIVNARLGDLAEQREKKRELLDQHYKEFEEKKQFLRQEKESRDNEKKKSNVEAEKIKEQCNIADAEHQIFVRSLRLGMQAILEIIDEIHESQALINKP
ncbi:hypothetical protein PS6_003804 [Mucor atramentarius]